MSLEIDIRADANLTPVDVPMVQEFWFTLYRYKENGIAYGHWYEGPCGSLQKVKDGIMGYYPRYGEKEWRFFRAELPI